jgi:MFS family permease
MTRTEGPPATDVVIETQHSRVPWRWVILMAMIGLPIGFGMGAGGNVVFTMRKLIESPAMVNFLTSLDVLFNVLVGTTCLYLSDKIWIKGLGRRVPFLLASWIVMGLSMLFIPMADSAWALVLLVVLWFGFQDAGTTWEVLKYEVVPPSQRGRYNAMQSWLFQVFIIFGAVVMSGRFEETVERDPFLLKGEVTSYWIGGVGLLIGALLIVLFVRERKPPAEATSTGVSALNPKEVWKNLVGERTLWPVYLLAFSTMLTSTGLGAIDGLLFIDQWGFSFQELGTNLLVGGLINLALIPLIGILVDRWNRKAMFLIGTIGSFCAQVLYYLFIQFVLPEQRPEIWHLILFGEVMSIFGLMSGISLMPLMFDYIPRNAMGTAQAGINIVRSLTRFATLNGIGIWVTWWSASFHPGKINYLSGYLFMFIMQLLGFAFIAYFFIQVRRGRIRPIGAEVLPTSSKEIGHQP